MRRVIYSQEPGEERRIAKGVVSCADHGHLASGRICAIHVAPAGHLAGRELAQTIQGRQIGVAAVRGAIEMSARAKEMKSFMTSITLSVAANTLP